MKKKDTKDEKIEATLDIRVTYETVPSSTDLMDVIEKARELGTVEMADLTIHRAVKQSLL